MVEEVEVKVEKREEKLKEIYADYSFLSII
jgi:hypothetical protein